jgi:hypothetical protein
MKLNSLATRDDVFKFIADSTIFGNLGLFVGAGLPMAILNNDYTRIALSWPQLLEKCCDNLQVDYNAIDKNGASYPQIATKVCRQYAELNGTTYDEAVNKLKQTLSTLTSWYPEKGKRQEYAQYFESLNPNWIITTNYDTIIESILTGKSYSLQPIDYMVAQQGLIPVYHLHGIRTYPNSIIITEEDYITLFRPNQYRQQKLPLTIKESVTLLIGYNLGDFNVLTAVDWSENVYLEQQISYPQDIIQFLRSDDPKVQPYRSHNNIVIVEFDDLSVLLSELKSVIDQSVTANKVRIKTAMRINEVLAASEEKDVKRFVDDEEFRKATLIYLNSENVYIISGFLEFFDKAISLTWNRASSSGAFHAYDENLIVLLDILTILDAKKIPPALMEAVVSKLNSVSYYIGDYMGKSQAAFKTWNARRPSIPDECIQEVQNISKDRNYFHVIELLKNNRVA